MDFSDIIFYIVLSAIGILSSIIPKKAKKTPIEKPQRPVLGEDGSFDNKNTFDPTWGENDEKEESGRIDTAPNTRDKAETSRQQPGEVTLDEIFRALRENRPLQPVPVVKPQVKVVEPQPTPVVKPVILHNKEGERATADIATEENQESRIYNEYEPGYEMDFNNIDWRQAVITSEILQRKY